MGRFTSVVGMIEAGSTVLMTALIGLFAKWLTIRPIYVVSSFIFLLFGLYIYGVVMNKEKERFYKEEMSV